MNRRPRVSSAFTLIELLLVLVLLTLVVSAVVPNFSKFSVGRQPKYTATQFLALTRYARTQATSEGRTYRMNFDTNAFFLTVDDGAGTFQEFPGEFGKKITMPSGVTMVVDVDNKEDAGRVIDFTPDGFSDQGKVTFTSAYGVPTEVMSEAPSDLFKVVDGGGR